MIFATLLVFAIPQEAQRIGDWKVRCESDATASDGLFDHCHMTKSIDGVQVTVERTVTGAAFSANISGCKIRTPVDPIIVPQEELAGPDGKEKFLGGQLRAIIANNRQCPGRGMTLSVGGPEVPELLAATSKLRPLKN